MTKFALLIASIGLASVQSFAAPLFKKDFNLVDEGEPKARIVETFQAALSATTPNKVQKAVNELKVELADGVGTVNAVTENDMFQIYSGKGSASSYGHEYLVGIPVSMSGTGLIETYEIYYRVYYAVDMALGTESVTIDKQVKIK